MRKIKREDYDHVVTLEDLSSWDYMTHEEAMAFADPNMDFVRINGKEIEFGFSPENRTIVVFGVDGTFDIADQAVEILKNCQWEDRKIEDYNNCICLIDGMHNCGVFYNF